MNKLGRIPASFILTGDVHLHDKPYKNTLERCQTLLNDLLALSLNNKKCPIFINGDIFHTPKPPYDVLMLFWNFCDKCEDHGIHLILNTGNHDYFSLQNPSESYLNLFNAFPSVTVVNEQPYFYDKWRVMVMPWRPGKVFKILLQEALKKIDKTKDLILLAHQPITEGVVNETGFKVNQDLSVKDFQPDKFKFVFLSDYHEYQKLASNVWCIGAPLASKFGESEQHGVVGVFYDKGQVSWEHIPLPSKYSEFVTYELKEDLYISDYDDYNYNRIYCPRELKTDIELLYPDAQVIGQFQNTKEFKTRLEGVDTDDLDVVFKEFIKTRNYEGKRDKMIMKKLLNHFYTAAKEKNALS